MQTNTLCSHLDNASVREVCVLQHSCITSELTTWKLVPKWSFYSPEIQERITKYKQAPVHFGESGFTCIILHCSTKTTHTKASKDCPSTNPCLLWSPKAGLKKGGDVIEKCHLKLIFKMIKTDFIYESCDWPRFFLKSSTVRNTNWKFFDSTRSSFLRFFLSDLLMNASVCSVLSSQKTAVFSTKPQLQRRKRGRVSRQQPRQLQSPPSYRLKRPEFQWQRTVKVFKLLTRSLQHLCVHLFIHACFRLWSLSTN